VLPADELESLFVPHTKVILMGSRDFQNDHKAMIRMVIESLATKWSRLQKVSGKIVSFRTVTNSYLRLCKNHNCYANTCVS